MIKILNYMKSDIESSKKEQNAVQDCWFWDTIIQKVKVWPHYIHPGLKSTQRNITKDSQVRVDPQFNKFCEGKP